MSPEQLAGTVARLQPLTAARIRAGARWDLTAFVEEAATHVGASPDPADVALVGHMLDHAARPEDPTPGEFAQLYAAVLEGAGAVEVARLQMALLGAVVIATWRARPAGDEA